MKSAFWLIIDYNYDQAEQYALTLWADAIERLTRH